MQLIDFPHSLFQAFLECTKQDQYQLPVCYVFTIHSNKFRVNFLCWGFCLCNSLIIPLHLYIHYLMVAIIFVVLSPMHSFKNKAILAVTRSIAYSLIFCVHIFLTVYNLCTLYMNLIFRHSWIFYTVVLFLNLLR